ncbi:MAG TPA: copper resistance protein CopC [Acidimicrobiales bacterium]|nr:copper resistance protein CopC [Acidimicrobiales bacterium]
MARALGGALLTIGLLFAAASPAAAHAELTETEPGGGAVLARPPRQVVLRFTESVEVSFGSIRVFDEDGERLETGRARHPDGRSSAVALELPALEKGAYVVTWRVLSADSHPVRGAFTFLVGAAPPGSEDGQALAQRLLNAEGGSTAVGAAYGAVRFAVFASLLLLVGGTAFILLLWPEGSFRPRARRMIAGAWMVAMIGTALGIGLQGAYAGGLGLADALKPSVYSAVLETRFGRVWAARLALLVLAGGLLWLLSRRNAKGEVAAYRREDDRADGSDPRPVRAEVAPPAGGGGPVGAPEPVAESPPAGGTSSDGGLASVGAPEAIAEPRPVGGASGGGGTPIAAAPQLVPERRPVAGTGASGGLPLVVSHRPAGWPVLAAAALLGAALLATPGLAGHAGAGSLVPLAMAADVAHLGAVSVWLGGLVVLAAVLLPQGDAGTMRKVVPRFSRVAFVAVVVILATGTLQGWRQVGSLDALTTTTFGRLLLVKVALFAGMVGLATASRRWVRRRYGSPGPALSPGPGATASEAADAAPADYSAGGRGATAPAGTAAATAGANAPAGTAAATAGTDADAGTDPGAGTAAGAAGTDAAVGPAADTASGPALTISRLRRSVLAEVAVAVTILAVTALLVNAVPANTALAKPLSVELVAKGLLVEVTVDPAKAGRLDLHLYTLTPAGAVRDVEDLTARLSLPAKDVGPITAPLRRAGPGHFAAYGFDVPIAGRWRLEVATRLTEVDVVRAAATVPIR